MSYTCDDHVLCMFFCITLSSMLVLCMFLHLTMKKNLLLRPKNNQHIPFPRFLMIPSTCCDFAVQMIYINEMMDLFKFSGLWFKSELLQLGVSLKTLYQVDYHASFSFQGHIPSWDAAAQHSLPRYLDWLEVRSKKQKTTT